VAFDRYAVAVVNPAEVPEHQVTASEAASLVGASIVSPPEAAPTPEK
jgi:hypothetical protein